MNYTIWGLFGPATWPAWLAALGFALLVARRPALARAALAASVTAFALLAILPTGLLLMRPLEARFAADPLR
ncbi:MAG: hypothetical protein INF91_05980, partial [Alphaproteobacteria bacterium]|nr:hypothetical protein [Alphaproteobacteria bacterium]